MKTIRENYQLFIGYAQYSYNEYPKIERTPFPPERLLDDIRYAVRKNATIGELTQYMNNALTDAPYVDLIRALLDAGAYASQSLEHYVPSPTYINDPLTEFREIITLLMRNGAKPFRLPRFYGIIHDPKYLAILFDVAAAHGLLWPDQESVEAQWMLSKAMTVIVDRFPDDISRLIWAFCSNI